MGQCKTCRKPDLPGFWRFFSKKRPNHYVWLEIQLIWSFGRIPFRNATAVGSQQVTGEFQAAPILTDHTIYWSTSLSCLSARNSKAAVKFIRLQCALPPPLYALQGLSYLFELLWRPQRPPKTNFLGLIKASVYSRGVAIWVSSTSFQKSDIGWPHQPPREKLLKFNGIFMILSKKFFFQNNKICL